MQTSMATKIRKAVHRISLVLFILPLVGGVMYFLPGRLWPTTIAHIAYDRNRSIDNRVFIEENGNFVPYIVLTANYGGSRNVLLLREHLLDNPMPINPSPHGQFLWGWQDFGAYYPNSYMDNFLNMEFMDTLGELVIAAMVPSSIEVTDMDSMNIGGGTSEYITRYVFLLSLREFGVHGFITTVPEGETLRFFRNDHTRRFAYFSNGMVSPYWTRTPDTLITAFVYTIGPNAISSGTADILNGVRPAFALDRSTAITTSTDIISGKTVFVLATE